MTRARRFLTALAAVLVAASAALADGMDDARRYLGFAKDLVDRNDRLEQVHEYLDKAEKALAPLPEGQKAALLADCKALRERAVALKLAYDIRVSDQRLERDLSSVKEEAEGRGRNKLMSPDDVEPIFARIEATLAAPEIQKVFDAAHKAEWRQKIDGFRGVALRTAFNNIYLEAEKWLLRVEEANSGASEHKYSEDGIEQYVELARKEIDKIPYSDKRRGELDDRYKAAVTGRTRRLAGDSREAAVGAAREWWAHNQRQSSGSQDRWATENAYEFNTWWREHGRLNLEKTEAHFQMAARTMDEDRWRAIEKGHQDDQRVKDLMKEVLGVAGEASKKIGLAADKLLAQAEGKIAESGATEVKERALSTLRPLELVADYSPEGKAALERCRALINRCHEIEVNGADPGPSAAAPTTPTATSAPPAGTTEPVGEGPGVEKEPEGKGGGGILPALLGCGCCSILLVAGGGGAFFMYKKQAAAAAAAAKPPTA